MSEPKLEISEANKVLANVEERIEEFFKKCADNGLDVTKTTTHAFLTFSVHDLQYILGAVKNYFKEDV